MNIPNSSRTRIVVIGCGFAGLKFCKKIDSTKYQIVLIDKNNYHTFQPLLYQVASSGLASDSIAYPIRKIFKGKKNFFFRKANVTKINLKNNIINTSIGQLEYDVLIIASGGISNYFGMINIKKYAMPMKTLTDSLNLRSLIIQNFEDALNATELDKQSQLMNFVIIGAGPTGIELAGALDELRRYVLPFDYPDLDIRKMQIHIIEANDRVLPAMSKKASAIAHKYLIELQIQLWLNTTVKDFDGEIVYTNKKNLFSNTLIWAAGIEGCLPNGLTIQNKINNRLIVDDMFKVIGINNVYAIGDVSYIKSKQYPYGNAMLASVAGQQGGHLAANFNNSLINLPNKPFIFKDKGTMATIGRNKAVVDLPFITFAGIAGWFTWMFVHLLLLVDFRSKLIVFINWAWSYIKYEKGTRLIIREFHRKKPAKK